MSRSALLLPAVLAVPMLLAACAGPNPEMNHRKMQLSPGVVALINSEEAISLNDARIRCEQRKPVGSNVPKRTCMLREEWDAARENSLRDTFGTGREGGQMGGRFDAGGG